MSMNQLNNDFKVLIKYIYIFLECLGVYGGDVTFLRAPFGDRPSIDQIEAALREKV